MSKSVSPNTQFISSEQPKLKPFRLFWSTRLSVSLIGCFGCLMVYALRSNTSFAIVCMVNGTAVELMAGGSVNKLKSSCQLAHVPNNKSEVLEGTLIWPKKVQGSVLSAFFWGYILSQVLGGYLSSRIGGKIVIGGAVVASTLLTLLSPVSANAHVYFFITIRAALGFVQGTVFPAFHTFFSLWAPPLERSFLVGLTLAGAQIGNVLVMPLSGLLCKYGFAGGWPSIYYVLGVVGLIWSAVWFYFISDTPAKNRQIDPEERAYIEASLVDVMSRDPHEKKRRIPWRSILASVPVWAIYCGHFAGDWGAYMMLTSLPLFMNDVLGFDLTSLGFLSAIPYIAHFIFINLSGIVADKLRDANLLSTIAVRRLAMLIALISQSIFLIASGYCVCGQETLIIVFLTLGIGLSGIQFAGYVVNYLDIAPTFAGPILGIGNTISCIAGILCPLMVGTLTPTGSKEEWQLVFWVTGAILIIGALMFSIFAKGEVQPWALAESNKAEAKVQNQTTVTRNGSVKSAEKQTQNSTTPTQ